jgi:hypothetical protein
MQTVFAGYLALPRGPLRGGGRFGKRAIVMPQGDVETYYKNGQWRNKVEGNQLASSVHEIKAAAVNAGMQMASARKVEHIIHELDGTIGERNSYANDPRNVPG